MLKLTVAVFEVPEIVTVAHGYTLQDEDESAPAARLRFDALTVEVVEA